jgi:uroporphyrinogen decarboxylase
MAGGMDKRILARDKRAIRDMVTGKKALLREGGYIPGCDHAIPPDIPWENFLYYHRLVDELSS